MATLYEIDERILNCIDQETGEIIDDVALDALLIERENKIEGVALWYKNLVADAAMYKAEKLSFAEKQKTAENKAEGLKRYLQHALNGEKFKTSRVQISYRKSNSVQIEDGARLPEEYLKYRDPEPDKTQLAKALKAGMDIAGVWLEERQNLQVK